MKIWKAIGLGIVSWVLIFFEVSVLMFGFKLQSGNIYYYIIHGILITIFLVVLSLIYFSKQTKGGLLNGLALGLVFLVIGIILDSLITIPLFKQGDYTFLFLPEILISELWGVILCTIVGALKK